MAESGTNLSQLARAAPYEWRVLADVRERARLLQRCNYIYYRTPRLADLKVDARSRST